MLLDLMAVEPLIFYKCAEVFFNSCVLFCFYFLCFNFCVFCKLLKICYQGLFL